MDYKVSPFSILITIFMITSSLLGEINSEQKVNSEMEQINSNSALIVAASPSNTLTIKSFKQFDKPIFMIGGDIVGEEYSANMFEWWDTYSSMTKPDLFDNYNSLNKYLSPEAVKAISEHSFEQFKANKSLNTEKRTIHYLILIEHLNESFLVIGSSQGAHVDKMPKSCGVTLMKKIGKRWFHHIYRDLNESLIYRLPLTQFDKMKELIKNKVWNSSIFDDFYFKQMDK